MSLCKANCGFYGQERLGGFCSLCHIPEDTTPIDQLTEPVAGAVQEKPKPVIEKKNRCFQCTKKIGLLGFECSCLHKFCQACRHAENHHCTFDYAKQGRDLIEKLNPLVAGSKLVRMD